jgi:hypothetical protein
MAERARPGAELPPLQAEERADDGRAGSPDPGARSAAPEGDGERARVSDVRPPVDLARLAWLLTVATLVTGTVILAIRGDVGYAIVAACVAAAAAINLL